MTFSTTAKNKNIRYAVFSVVFLIFAGLWALSPLISTLGGKTNLDSAAASMMFINKKQAVDLSYIGLSDVFASDEAGTAADAGKVKKVSMAETSALSSIETGGNMSLHEKEVKEKSKSASDGRYTPPKDSINQGKVVASAGIAETSAEGAKIKPAGGLFSGGGQSSSATAKIKKDFFGASNSEAELEKKSVSDFQGRKPEAVKRLETMGVQVKSAQSKSSEEAKQEGVEEAYRENLAVKDIHTDIEEYKKTAMTKILEIKNKALKPGETIATFSQKVFYAPPMPQPEELSEKEKKEWIEFYREKMELQMEMQAEAQKSQFKNSLLMMIIQALFGGPVMGLGA